MARHNDAHFGGRWMNVKVRKVMQHVDKHFTRLKRLAMRNALGPRPEIVVSAYGCERRERSKLFQHLRVPDVPGVYDEIAAAKKVDDFRAHQAVRIRNQADAHRLRIVTRGRRATVGPAITLNPAARKSGSVPK